MQIWCWCIVVLWIVVLLKIWQTKVMFWIHSICLSMRGKGDCSNEIFSPMFLLSCFPNILTSSLVFCQYSKFYWCKKTENIQSLENLGLSFEILVYETPEECLDESLNVRVWHCNVRVGRLSRYFMSVVTMFLGILENSSRGVMTTMGAEPGSQPIFSLARRQ